MIDKHIFDDNVRTVKEIAGKYKLSGDATDPKSIQSEIAAFSKEVKNYAFRIMMLGVFSSGKSAFLNKMLKDSLLTEAQNPETTIATELCFGLENRLEAIGNDNSVTVLNSPEDVKKLDLSRYSHLVFRLNNEFLKKHSDIIFVDMPGIDSNIEVHNKAISRYICLGSAYILLISAKEGGVRQSVSDFLQEIRHYPQSLGCFISMSELLLPQEAENVRKHTASVLRSILYEDIPVNIISSRNDSDEEFRRKTEETISLFNPQFLFKARYSLELSRIVTLLCNALQTYKNSCTLNTDELEEKIIQCKHIAKKLQTELLYKKNELQRQSRITSEKICNDVQENLVRNLDRIVHAAQSGEESLKSTITSLTRQSLIQSSQENVVEDFRKIINSIINDCDDRTEDGQVILDRHGPMARPDKQQEKINEILEVFNKDKSYSGISDSTLSSIISGTVAATSSVFDSILKIVLAFVPYIMNWLSGQSREDAEREKAEKIRSTIQNSVIPKICNEIQNNVTKAVENSNNQMINELEDTFMQLIENEEAAIRQAQKEIQSRTAEHQHNLSEIEADLHTLDMILKQLQN